MQIILSRFNVFQTFPILSAIPKYDKITLNSDKIRQVKLTNNLFFKCD